MSFLYAKKLPCGRFVINSKDVWYNGEFSKSSIRVGKYVSVLPALILVGCLEKILRLRQGSVGKMAGSKKTG